MMKNINVLFSAILVFVFLALGSCRNDKEIPPKQLDKTEECDKKCQEEKQKKEEDEKKKQQEEEKKKTEEEQKKKEEENRKEEERKQKEKEEEEKRKGDEVAKKKDSPFIFVMFVGDNNGKKIKIPLNDQFLDRYNFDVKWKGIDTGSYNNTEFKGEVHIGNDNNINKGVIYVPKEGDYRVEITGDFPAIYFNNIDAPTEYELLRIEQWGGIQWETMNRAFAGCRNLKITAKDAPDLSKVRDISYMFENAWRITGNFNHWDVSNIGSMKGMFKGASAFNQPIDKWDVGNVQNMSLMFYDAKLFNQSLNNWNVSNVYHKNDMFSGAKSFNNKNLPNSWK